MATWSLGLALPARTTHAPSRARWRAALAACALALSAGFGNPVLAAETDADAPSEASYLRLHPDFVVNLQGPGGPHFLLASIDVMGRDPDMMAQAEHHAAAIRHELVLLLSEQQFDTVNDADARQRLQRAALAAVNDVLEREKASAQMEGLFFSNFVVE